MLFFWNRKLLWEVRKYDFINIRGTKYNLKVNVIAILNKTRFLRLNYLLCAWVSSHSAAFLFQAAPSVPRQGLPGMSSSAERNLVSRGKAEGIQKKAPHSGFLGPEGPQISRVNKGESLWWFYSKSFIQKGIPTTANVEFIQEHNIDLNRH